MGAEEEFSEAESEASTPALELGPESVPLINPEKARIWEDEFRVLHLQAEGKHYADIHPRRAFPVSGKANYVSFLDANEREVALLADPERLDEESSRTLDRALQRMYYVPKIVAVLSISEAWGVSRWEVLTDRGYASFEVTNHEDIRKLPNGRYLIHDADGNRFEIENANKLDPRSQALIQSET